MTEGGKIGQTLRDAAARLEGVGDTPRLDAELLMAHATGTTREAVLLGDQTGEAPAAFEALLRRRLAHEPVAYINGHKGFRSIDLAVTPAVLIPRPESEGLIEAALAHFGTRAPKRILDLGTGSGALLLAALTEWPEATGEGVDLSKAALTVAAANAWRLHLEGRARFSESSWKGDPEADLVLCNPPYIGTGEALPPSVARYEPRRLPPDRGGAGFRARRRRLPGDRRDAGTDGFRAVRRTGFRGFAAPGPRRAGPHPCNNTESPHIPLGIGRASRYIPKQESDGQAEHATIDSLKASGARRRSLKDRRGGPANRSRAQTARGRVGFAGCRSRRKRIPDRSGYGVVRYHQ